MSENIKNGVHQQLEGFYKVAVVDSKTNEIVYEQPDWKKNLILNNGMDQIYSSTIANCFSYGLCGTGTRVNSISSGGSSGSVAGTTLTLLGGGSLTDFTAPLAGYSATVEVGDMVKFSNGTEVQVTNVGGPSTLTVTPSTTVTALTFDIWKTSQTGLHIEKWRTNNYVSGSNYCSTSYSGSTVVSRRTYDFPTETGSLVNFLEVGVGWSPAVSLTTFSRILLGSAVPVDVGQRLRLIYQLSTTYAPTTPVSLSAIVTGWPVGPSTNTSASQMIQQFTGGGTSFVTEISPLGASQGFAFLEPSSTNAGWFLSNVGTPLAPFGSNVARHSQSFSSTSGTKAAYVTGSYTCDKSITYNTTEFGHDDIQSMGFGSGSAASASNQAFVLVFDQDQAKSTVQTLSLTYRWTWGRTLA